MVQFATQYIPKPSFPSPVLDGLSSLKQVDNKDHAIVATWWDYGYASMFLNGLPTLHDGGSQTSPTTYFVARALLADQAETVNILRFLSTNTHESLTVYKSQAELFDAMNSPSQSPTPDIYLVLSNQMAGWMSSISTLGNWDIETGLAKKVPNNNNSTALFYRNLNCRYGATFKKPQCGNINFDLEAGLINDQTALSSWAFNKDGFFHTRRDLNLDGNLAFQINQYGTRIESQVMHAQLYGSSFNQLFHQGDIKHSNLKLFYDDYPIIRIFKIPGIDAQGFRQPLQR